MKHIFALLCLSLTLFSYSFGQSQIVSITHEPVSPTDTDTIYVYANLQFPSSDCPLDFKGHEVSGPLIFAQTQHCMGPMTAICDAVDVFKIEPLTEGTYYFVLSLSGGMGEPPCTPGIVIDDMDTLVINVSGTPVGIEEPVQQGIEIYPNPVSQFLTINESEQQIKKVRIASINGSYSQDYKISDNHIDVNKLPAGAYFITLYFEEGNQTIKFLKQ